jgi:vancomycin resistance protein YoaR
VTTWSSIVARLRLFAGRASELRRADLARILACMVLGGVAGYLLVPSHGGSTPAGQEGEAPIVVLEGRPLSITGDPASSLDAARVIAREWASRRMVVTGPGSKPRETTREQLGARIDAARLAAVVTQLRDPRSAVRRAHGLAARGKEGPPEPLRFPLPVRIDGARALATLVALKDDIDRRPLDARLDVGAHKVLPDEAGRRMDVHATLARLDKALLGRPAGDATPEEIEAVVEAVPASRTAAQIADIQLGEVLGWFETKVARDLKHEARTFNLRLAASKLDGHVLMPGEVFDFNEVVGARSEANGYKVATVIAQGELVDGIGGGTCQVAGTLHGAAFFAGLDIVERKPHTRPSFYIKMGMDAAVAYPAITLRLRNPYPYPVVLHETVEAGIARAEVLGPKRTRDVTFVRKTNEVTPFAEKEVPDAKIPKGERVLTQRGIPGFKVTRYRLLRDGAFAIRERMTDVYPATTQIWRVGTGEPDPKFEPKDDEHPEYVADDYLAISQGPHIIVPSTGRPSTEPGGAMVESRVAGRYGTHGWTEREGFAKPRPRRARKAAAGGAGNPTVEDDAVVD